MQQNINRKVYTEEEIRKVRTKLYVLVFVAISLFLSAPFIVVTSIVDFMVSDFWLDQAKEWPFYSHFVSDTFEFFGDTLPSLIVAIFEGRVKFHW